ncbi:MAG: HEPN domain-containing protein [Candidatus Margulisbacteria bacterium]|nr:HEPN domain-containing protein [Candidatus Margulisiibacteriota bacterium]MBU1021663.1 HEPN domain-containing protein [Candidatus Margulisiibacteriota bacterium]MBU1728813.1 HEPN domain-containing protein [Candidatus Margulisiibacteriota bacterium]MBU1955779.1 HEPN domain-containing protein [Candidatus Margulisiibacteriota bacterium]
MVIKRKMLRSKKSDIPKFRKKELIRSVFIKSIKAYEDAEICFDEGRFGAAISRAYFSVFHALRAILLMHDLSYLKRSSLISAFSKYFIKENIFPADFVIKAKKLWKFRKIADYDPNQYAGEQDAEVSINDAKEITWAIQTFLFKKHWWA